MTAQDTKAQLGLLMKLWSQKSETRDHHDALMYAFLGYLVSRGAQDDEGAMGFIGPIEAACFEILEPLLEKRKQQAKAFTLCGFCGRGEEDVKLAAGPDAFICEGCVRQLYEEFFPKQH
jgi:hypothetical protein